MIGIEFVHKCHILLDEIERRSFAKIEEAAELIAESICSKGTFHVYDRGHILSNELIARAGGAAFVRVFEANIPDMTFGGMAGTPKQKLNCGIKGESQENKMLRDESYLKMVFEHNGISSSDVLLINSNSGRGAIATSVAKIAREKGVKLVVCTSVETSELVEPEYGGVKLVDYADILIDNCAPYGDAMLDVGGLDEKLGPASGITAACIGWALVCEITERLIAKGIMPTVYRSVNIAGGPEQNTEAIARYDKLLY